MAYALWKELGSNAKRNKPAQNHKVQPTNMRNPTIEPITQTI